MINQEPYFAVWTSCGMFEKSNMEIGEIPIHLNNRLNGARRHF